MVQSSSKAWLISLLGLALISIKAVCSDKPNSPPQAYVIWEQKKPIYVGQDVELFCTILTKDHNTKYRWYYSDAELPNERNLGVLIDPRLYKQPPYNGDSKGLAHVIFTLKLLNLTIDQSGHYACQAENSVGNDSRVTNLTVTNRHSIPVTTGAAPTFSDPNMLKRAFRAWPASHNTRLKCKANGTPPLKYTWLKDGEKMQTRRMDPHFNSSLWYLKLKDLRPEDSGKYTCIVSNPYGIINHTYTLKVVAKARSKPILQKGLPRNTTVEVGGNATMTCIVLVSGTLPDFRWLKWNKSITSVPYPVNNENLGKGSNQLIDSHYYKAIQVWEHYGVELTITDVTEDDFGLYTCVVSNLIGRDYSSAFLRRYVKPRHPLASDKAKARSKPILQKGLPRNTTVEIGGNATMKCIVLVSGTLPDFRWLKWNKSITSVPYPKINENLRKGSYQLIDPHYYKSIQVGEHYGVELRINDVTEDDFGLYTCVVSNHIGMDYSSAFLRRHVKPKHPLASDKVTEREKTSWTSRIQYPWALIGVSVAVIIALIIVTVWFCWKLKKVRTYAGRPSSGIASLQPKYDVHNEYVVIPDFK